MAKRIICVLIGLRDFIKNALFGANKAFLFFLRCFLLFIVKMFDK